MWEGNSRPLAGRLMSQSMRTLKTGFMSSICQKGLESGLVVPTRQHVVEGGLRKVQEVLDLMLQGGVSGRKLIIDPWV